MTVIILVVWDSLSVISALVSALFLLRATKFDESIIDAKLDSTVGYAVEATLNKLKDLLHKQTRLNRWGLAFLLASVIFHFLMYWPQ